MIHFNTLIHPFTLADNRHYVFYVFRYSILFHPLIRYLLAPIYMLCFWLSSRTLSTPRPTILTSSVGASKSNAGRTETEKKTQDRTRSLAIIKLEPGPSTSFLLIWILTTALSLVTAPLVEPRYFIIPWVVWRLHVPSWSSSHLSGARKGKRGGGLVEGLRYWTWKGYDYRLWIETAWFLVINAVTGYVFLYRGFAWVQEPGLVQRFMW